MIEVLDELIARMDITQGKLITFYYGANSDRAEAERIVDSYRQKYPDQEIEVIQGGQPHYNYIVSVE